MSFLSKVAKDGCYVHGDVEELSDPRTWPRASKAANSPENDEAGSKEDTTTTDQAEEKS